MIIVARCTEESAVPSDIVRCSHCGHDCWISKYAGPQIQAMARMTGDDTVICTTCFDLVFGTGTQ